MSAKTAKFLALLTVNVILAGGIVVTLLIVSKRNAKGIDARNRQVQVFPVMCDIYAAEYKRGVLTLHDIHDILEAPPAPCPALEKIYKDAIGRTAQ